MLLKSFTGSTLPTTSAGPSENRSWSCPTQTRHTNNMAVSRAWQHGIRNTCCTHARIKVVIVDVIVAGSRLLGSRWLTLGLFLTTNLIAPEPPLALLLHLCTKTVTRT